MRKVKARERAGKRQRLMAEQEKGNAHFRAGESYKVWGMVG